MAIQVIELGTSPTGAGGDEARGAFEKVNDNFADLDQRVEELSSPKLSAIANAVWAANKGLYLTGEETVGTFDFTVKARAYLGSADEAAMRTFLQLSTYFQGANDAAPTQIIDFKDHVRSGPFYARGAGMSTPAINAPPGSGPTTLIVEALRRDANTTIFQVVQPAVSAGLTGRRQWFGYTDGTTVYWSRVMTEGNYGLGGTDTTSIQSISDYAAVFATGFYRATSSTLNRPPNAATTCSVTAMWTSASSTIFLVTQVATQNANLRSWVGSYNGTSVFWAETPGSFNGLLIDSDTGQLGFATGAGGAVTQATSKSTGVTLNKPTGQITLNAESLASYASVGFTLTNSRIAANDLVDVQIKSGSAGAASYLILCDQKAAGSCRISLRNLTSGALAEALVLQFNLNKGAVA